MSYGLKQIREYAFIEPEEKELLKSIRRPIVLLLKKEPNPLSKEVSPENRYLGAMLPYTPLHYLILASGFTALVMTSGSIWGGEILIVEPALFRRAASLSYVPMPGSASAIKEPWRMAVSYLYHAFGEEFWDLDLPLLKEIEEKNITIITEMISKNINSPLTSSLGRLFDGIASIIGIRNYVSFEGQAAMELEMLADGNSEETYDYEWLSDDTYKLLTQSIICGVVKDMETGIHPARISSKFHTTLIKLFSELFGVIRKESGLNRIVLSGGVFQNSILLTGLIKILDEKNFEVYTHSKVPTNDGGISLGQAVVAAAIAKR